MKVTVNKTESFFKGMCVKSASSVNVQLVPAVQESDVGSKKETKKHNASWTSTWLILQWIRAMFVSKYQHVMQASGEW